MEQVQSDNPAALARLKHAEARLEALRTGIAELQKQADQQADGRAAASAAVTAAAAAAAAVVAVAVARRKRTAAWTKST